jgi:C1A family cysteine protease
MKRKYGWKKQRVDLRDVRYKVVEYLPIKTVYLTPVFGYNLPPVWDQLDLGCCTGFGWAFMVMFAILNKDFQSPATPGYTPSQLFIYYWERFLEGTVGEDSGAEIRDGAKVINTYGVCNETTWPYVDAQLTVEPSSEAIAEALNYTSITYEALDNTNKQELVDALQRGFPIVFGFSVFQSFESDAVAASGIVPYPPANDPNIGGHCCAIIGYHEGVGDDDWFLCRNSWGTSWGHNGYFTIPARYLTDINLASDFWILKLIK